MTSVLTIKVPKHAYEKFLGATKARVEAEQMAERALEHVSGEEIFVRHDIATQPSLDKRIWHMDEVRRG